MRRYHQGRDVDVNASTALRSIFSNEGDTSTAPLQGALSSRSRGAGGTSSIIKPKWGFPNNDRIPPLRLIASASTYESVPSYNFNARQGRYNGVVALDDYDDEQEERGGRVVQGVDEVMFGVINKIDDISRALKSFEARLENLESLKERAQEVYKYDSEYDSGGGYREGLEVISTSSPDFSQVSTSDVSSVGSDDNLYTPLMREILRVLNHLEKDDTVGLGFHSLVEFFADQAWENHEEELADDELWDALMSLYDAGEVCTTIDDAHFISTGPRLYQ